MLVEFVDVEADTVEAVLKRVSESDGCDCDDDVDWFIVTAAL